MSSATPSTTPSALCVRLDQALGQLGRGIAREGAQGYVAYFEEANPGKKARVRDLGHALSYNTRIVGTPKQIADAREESRDAGVDGVNLIYQT